MTARNKLLTAPPYAVEQSLKRLGADLRTARLRRNLTIDDVAEKIGTGPRAIGDAEKGKPSTSAAVYAALGAFASLTGTLFGVWAASPWTYIFVANLLLLLALSMLDVFQVPTFQFLSRWSPERKGNGYVSALLIGASSGLIVGPCTAPALGAVLAFVGTQGSVVFGTSVLFVFALGMGALMIALGTFGGALAALPRSGAWMVRVKKAFGIAMILIAEYLLLQAGQRFV